MKEERQTNEGNGTLLLGRGNKSNEYKKKQPKETGCKQGKEVKEKSNHKEKQKKMQRK